ncbi:heme ABC transporter permease [Pseudohongiella sp. SYSU M77423]|uniref:heme ABC transporter permease n=1 Tax=unclassified Pseudohongiella TaxID=2629611 RepID=UPI001F41F193|nr:MULTISPECIES: heme ABC transporter permease [unclassified Pseudohongiella]MDH7943001.1 heme ABC transporter permease [Pseudohongiella sp. SYSU M77423]
MWLWFSKLGSPRWFYELSGKWLPWLYAAMVLLGVIGLTWALLFVPEDYQQGQTIRIMYVHVPVASISLAAFPLMAVAGTITLVWKMKLADMVAKCAAPIGLWFTGLALATGAIWGEPIWGTWWAWDARLTSMLIQFFLFIGVVALRSAIESPDNAAKACAVLSIVGAINVPIIKYSVEWWNTLHQPSSDYSMDPVSPNPPEVWVPLVIMICAVYVFFVITLILRTRNEILVRERRSQWVKDLVARA